MKKLLLFIKFIRLGDIFFIVLFTGLIIFIINRSWNMPVGQYLKIESNSKVTKVFSLNQTSNKKIFGLLGDSEINITEGKARFSKSPCTKKYCVHQGWINKVNQTIVCLPNQILISITDGNESYDSVNY
jgi:hypothetical protein|tara:strand:- start:1592 stop:1978 length:387 start_codon:yes stop_codon:yes gene_type:complete